MQPVRLPQHFLKADVNIRLHHYGLRGAHPLQAVDGRISFAGRARVAIGCASSCAARHVRSLAPGISVGWRGWPGASCAVCHFGGAVCGEWIGLLSGRSFRGL